MRIVHINVTAAFSTGRIAIELCRQAMREGHRALLCYSRGVCPSDVPSYRIGSTVQTAGYTLLSRLTDRQGFFARRETEKLVAQLKKFKPDIVHLHNLHGSYLHLPTLFAYLKENDLPTVWTLHDCWAFTGHCAYFSLGKDAAPGEDAGGRRRRHAEACRRGMPALAGRLRFVQPAAGISPKLVPGSERPKLAGEAGAVQRPAPSGC